MKAETKFSATMLYALAFGFFLGLCIWKFGNPVILDQKIPAPVSVTELLDSPWPLHWARWILLPLAVGGVILISQKKISWPQTKWLWLLPLAWLGWQMLSAEKTVDADLTKATLWQFSGCVVCYFIVAFLFRNRPALTFLLVGILAAFTFSLVRAVDQKLFEFPLNN